MLSIIANNIPSVFNVHEKFLAFILLLLFASNLISNDNLSKYRRDFLNAFYYIGLGLIFVSFLGLISGEIPLQNVKETSGGFAGLFSNSIFLGGVTGPLIIMSFSHYITPNTKKYKRIFAILSFIICCYILLLTGARSGILCLSFGFLYLLIRHFGLKKFLLKYWFIILLFCIVIYYLISIDFFYVISSKMSISEEMGRHSRESIWGNRIMEFKNNPLFGIGFSSVDLNFSIYELKESGNIEPGSSWLFVLSSLGIFGALAFLNIIRDAYKSIKIQGNLQKYTIDAIIIFFFIHMIFEGYIFAIGNILVYIFYICLSLNKNKYYVTDR